MKIPVTILGVGMRKAGVSTKTQRPYDFTEVSILYKNPQRMEGEIGEIVAIDSKVLDGKFLIPGDKYEVEMWTQNFKTMIGAIYG